MAKFTKIVRIGSTRTEGNIFCKIEFKEDSNLSITGVMGPLKNGNSKGACGQIDMDEWDIVKFAPGWNLALMNEFRSSWGKWHLNDMKAGSPAQTRFISENPVYAVYPISHHDVASKALSDAGLNPDPDFMQDGKPYTFGSAWLRVDVPESVLEFLQSLPDSDKIPAWV